MNPKELDAWYKSMNSDENKDATLDSIYGDLLKKQLVGGVILNTNPDGTRETYTITESDINNVVEAIDTAHKQSALFVAAGTDGLKDR
ncbi:hypothetical protein [Rhodococcus sp. IEGM 1374]|uniref:hypothetical protein n=1 Tax=Rhodococcus sp. IEGM 1374 TaxID=3082221 RepID=UPI002953F558|nr:hypothetical protein [Rhodococcus sp. IEGM 1374]